MKIFRKEIEKIPDLIKIVFFARITRWIIQNAHDFTGESETYRNQNWDSLWEIIEGITTKRHETNLWLANTVWKIQFDLTVELQTKSQSQVDYKLSRIVRLCSVIVYNTILAKNTQGIPRTVYINRVLDIGEELLQRICEIDTNKEEYLQRELRNHYELLNELVGKQDWNEEVPLSQEYLEINENNNHQPPKSNINGLRIKKMVLS